jgi:hypothetical protein
MRRLLLLAVLLCAPLLVGFTDPPRDLVSCTGTTAVNAEAPIDILRASGSAIQDGQALVFKVTFAGDLPVPDPGGRPLRMDVLLNDRDVPTVSFEYYRDLNRIVRFDAVTPPMLQILLLPEKAQNVFSGVHAEGDTLRLELPTRLVARDGDLAGFDLAGLRWTVLSRDGSTCDFLDAARPTLKLDVVSTSSPGPSSPPSTSPVTDTGGGGSGGFVLACVLGVLVGGGIGFGAAQWRRRPG